MPVERDETTILPAPLTHRQREVRKAARFALMGMLAPHGEGWAPLDVARYAVNYGEALVAELERREAGEEVPS